jgi:hypothetical protein
MNIIQLKNTLGISGNFNEDFAYYPQLQYIKVKRDHSAISGELGRSRFRFDFEESGLMEYVVCRLYSRDGSLPPHEHYDEYPLGSNNIYEYLVNSDKKLIVDYYPIDMIEVVELREVD